MVCEWNCSIGSRNLRKPFFHHHYPRMAREFLWDLPGWLAMIRPSWTIWQDRLLPWQPQCLGGNFHEYATLGDFLAELRNEMPQAYLGGNSHEREMVRLIFDDLLLWAQIWLWTNKNFKHLGKDGKWCFDYLAIQVWTCLDWGYILNQILESYS